MSDIFRTIVIISIGPMFIGSIVNADELLPLTATDVVDHYKSAVAWTVTYAMTLKVNTNILKDTKGRTTTTRREYELEHRRDGNRVEWMGTSRLLDENNTTILSQSSDFLEFTDGKRHVFAEKYLNQSHDDGYSASLMKDHMQSVLLKDPSYGNFLDGRVGGIGDCNTLTEALKKDPILLNQEEVNGTLCYVVQSKTVYGTVTAWIAPQLGYNALKYTIRKADNDLINNKPIDKTSITEWVITVDQIKIEQVGSVFLPTIGTYTHATTFKDGRSNNITVTANRANVSLSPDFKAIEAFTIKLPPRTPIRSTEFPGIVFECVDGSLVPMADEEAVIAIDRSITQLQAKTSVDKVSLETKGTEHTTETRVSNERNADTPKVLALDASNSVCAWIWAAVISVGVVSLLALGLLYRHYRRR